jgi:hypothetical protein
MFWWNSAYWDEVIEPGDLAEAEQMPNAAVQGRLTGLAAAPRAPAPTPASRPCSRDAELRTEGVAVDHASDTHAIYWRSTRHLNSPQISVRPLCRCQVALSNFTGDSGSHTNVSFRRC